MGLSDLPVKPIDHLPLAGAAVAGAEAQAIAGKAGALSYAALEESVGQMAGWLDSLGFAPGARVASWVAKGRLACILPLAAPRAGLIHVPVNPLLKRAQVAHIVADSGARLLIGTPARLAALEPGDVPQECRAIAEDAALAGSQASDPVPPSAAAPDDLAAILYTSGSTGRPKGVMLSHRNLWLGAVSVAEYLHLSPEDRVLGVLPFSFDYGQNQMFSTWAAGGAVVPLDYLTARDVMKAVEREDITTLAGVPPLWVQLTEADWPTETAARLRRITNSGGALTKALIGRLSALFPNADIYPMYGLTEAFRSTYLPPELVATHPESMGRAIPHAEILVCRPDGSLTAEDEPGELVHCGPLVAQGYWNDPVRTAERFRPAPPSSSYDGLAVWSGDTVRRDGEGLLYFVGREDAMIKSAGNRISPTEVEEAAQSVPGVAEAVALGVPDARQGQAVLLLVRVTDDSAVDALRESLKKELPNFMMPSDIRVVEAFPRNANGKIDRVLVAQDWRMLAKESVA
ncbi:acyl-CoA ligase (AMP-forming), exosortase A system-associated [Sphingobium sp. DEHP117]|uniref:acyl-CoA ligase (AMP-forming), exosortase A system-associated n=1 Tax=Sphingobium sp. DEHP117 TaxID=2993436 RepID=UPI0027D6A113|nr:acyl-CoA ligase (AMP-forming), exosortase A system-associated [Sphingobium sp. DEHP117]MDQ4419640.1 acyl-CoA ligase (AMP-forming), exosortase A system-associated [Sphingobium sp. DEHP117]